MSMSHRRGSMEHADPLGVWGEKKSSKKKIYKFKIKIYQITNVY